MTVISLTKKFGLSESVRDFLNIEVLLDCLIPIDEVFSVVYGMEANDKSSTDYVNNLADLIDFPNVKMLDTGHLTIYEELAILYGAMLRMSEKHAYSYTNHDDIKILQYGVRILTNLRDLEKARCVLYAETMTGVRRNCLVHDAETKAKALDEITNHYIQFILSYL